MMQRLQQHAALLVDRTMLAGGAVVQAVSVDADLDTLLGSGRVVVVKRRTTTLETAAGMLITLAAPTLGNGPNAVLVDQRPWLADTHFTAVGSTGLRFTAGPALDWSAASRWSTANSAPAAPPTVANAAALAAALECYEITAGLLPVVLGKPATDPMQQALTLHAAPLIAALPKAEAAHGLIGLGPGATPAGDDLLAGLLLTLHYARHPMAPALRAVAFAAQTTRLGRAMLRWAAHGKAREYTLRLLRDLFSQPIVAALPMLETVLHYGATSGADTVAGIVLGLRLLEGERPR